MPRSTASARNAVSHSLNGGGSGGAGAIGAGTGAPGIRSCAATTTEPALTIATSTTDHGTTRTTEKHGPTRTTDKHGRTRNTADHGTTRTNTDHGRTRTNTDHGQTRTNTDNGRTRKNTERRTRFTVRLIVTGRPLQPVRLRCRGCERVTRLRWFRCCGRKIIF